MPPKKEKPKGQSRPLGPIEYRYIPKLYFPLPTSQPPVTTNVHGRPSNARTNVSPAQTQKEQVNREKTVEFLQEMFRGRVDPELVKTILSDCGWHEATATDTLIKLSEGSDRGRPPSFDTQYHQAAYGCEDTDFRREITRLNAYYHELAEDSGDTDEYAATLAWATADTTVHPTAPQLSHSASPSLRSLTLQEAAVGCSASDPQFVERTLAQAASRLELRAPTPTRSSSSANGTCQMSPPLLLQPQQQQQQRVRVDDPSNDLGRRQPAYSAGTTPRSTAGAGAPFKNIASAVSSESLEQNAASWQSSGPAADSLHGCRGMGNSGSASPQLSPSHCANGQQSQEQQASLDVHYIQLAHGDIVLEKGTFLLQRAGSSSNGRAEGHSLSPEPGVPFASPAFTTSGDRAAPRDALAMPLGGDLAMRSVDGRCRAEPGCSLASAGPPVSSSTGSSIASADFCRSSSSSSPLTSLGSVDGTSGSSSSGVTGVSSTGAAMAAAASGSNCSSSSSVTISSSTAAATASSADVSMASVSGGSRSTSSSSSMDISVTSNGLSVGCAENPVTANPPLAFSASSSSIFSLGASSAFMAAKQGQETRSWSSVAGDCAQPPARQTAVERNLAEPPFRVDGGRAAAVVESSLKELMADIGQSASRGIKILILMRGCPGSGKSTLARLLKGDKGIVLSTDDFFMVDSRYEYDSSRIGEAHTWNQKRAEQALKDGVTPVIIDNTNTMLWEMGPYACLAIDHEYRLVLCEPVTEWRFNAKELHRKTSHGVPINVIEAMLERYEHNLEPQDVIRFAQRNRLPAMPRLSLTPRPTNVNNSSCTEPLRPAASSEPQPPALARASVSLLSPDQVGEVAADARTRSSSIGRHKMKSQTIRRNCLSPEVEKIRDKNVGPLQMSSPDTRDCPSPAVTMSHSAAAASVAQTLGVDSVPASPNCASAPKAPVSPVANLLLPPTLSDTSGGSMLAQHTPDVHQGAISGGGQANQAPSRPADVDNEGVAAAAASCSDGSEQQQLPLVTLPMTKRMAASLAILPAVLPIAQGLTEVTGTSEALSPVSPSSLSPPAGARATTGTVATPGDFVLAERLVRKSAGPDVQAAVASGWRVVAASEATCRQSHRPRLSESAAGGTAGASAVAASQQHPACGVPPLLRPVAIVCFDKSTMTDDDDPAGSSGVDGEQQLASLFPRVPAEYLRELLGTCKGNVLWATNTLLDSGYDEADFQCVPASVGTDSPVTTEASLTGTQGTPHTRQSCVGTTPFTSSSTPTHSAKRKKKKTYRMLSPQSWASFYLSPRPSDGSRGTHLCGAGSCGHPEHRADFARAAAASGTGASDFVNVTLTSDSVLHLAKLFGGNGSDQGTGITGVDLPIGTVVDVKLPVALAHELHCAIRKTMEATRVSTVADDDRNGVASRSVTVFPAQSLQARPSDADALGYCELERTTAQAGSPLDCTQQAMSDADLARLLQYEDINSQVLPPPLYEIMDAQLAEQLEHEEHRAAFGGWSTELTMAERLRRQQLYSAYPNEKIEMLNATFDECGRNPLRAMDVLGRRAASTDDHSSPATVAASVSSEDFDDEWEDVLDDPGNCVGTNNALTMTGDQLYQQSRSQANFHLALKKEYTHKAMQARSKGSSAAATVAWYTQQARSHAAEARHCHKLAARRIFNARNRIRQAASTLNLAQPQAAGSPLVVELHGLHAGEAVVYLRTVIDSTRAELAQQPGSRRRQLTVITGKGTNSRGGIPRVKQAVVTYLLQKDVSFTEINEGVLQVNLYRSDAA